MREKMMLEIHSPENLYKELSVAFLPYKEEPVGSVIFIVEGSLEKPRIGIRYPGRKLVRRILKNPRKNSMLWANLLDFEVIPFEGGKECSSKSFTYSKMLEDFDNFKKKNDIFWKLITEVYEHNLIKEEPPKLDGVDSRKFLEMLKWMWIQEDVNYRLSCKDVGSEIPYCLQNKSGSATSKGAGRKKFYTALLLVREHNYSHAEMRKIIP